MQRHRMLDLPESGGTLASHHLSVDINHRPVQKLDLRALDLCRFSKPYPVCPCHI
jgi:hypothetical protein